MNQIASLFAAAASTIVVVSASVASAQDAPPAPTPAPAPAVESAPTAAQPPAALPPPPPPTAPQPLPASLGESAPNDDRDGGRFRGAIAAVAGALIYPDAGLTLGIGGVQAEIGGQINDLVGIVALPGLGIVFGEQGGVYLDAAAVVDFTIDDFVSLGVGPDAMVFAAIGGDASGASGSAGALVGGRAHFAIHPVLGYGQDGVRRKALSIGVDLRFLSGPAGAAEASSSGEGSVTASDKAFIFSPVVTLGYTAF